MTLCAAVIAPSATLAASTPKKPGSVYVQLWEDKPGNVSKRDAPFATVSDGYVELTSTATGQKINNLEAGVINGKNSVRYKNLKPGTYEVEIKVPGGYKQSSKRIKRVKVKSGKVKIMNFTFKKKKKNTKDETTVVM